MIVDVDVFLQPKNFGIAYIRPIDERTQEEERENGEDAIVKLVSKTFPKHTSNRNFEDFESIPNIHLQHRLLHRSLILHTSKPRLNPCMLFHLVVRCLVHYCHARR